MRVKGLLYKLNYFDAPVVKEKAETFLVLESVRNKVWNPVFTVGVIAFVLSMTLRGFFDQNYAAITLGLSALVLFSGVWILSAVAVVVFDKNESKVYFIYKHLGYLQKIYVQPLTSIDEIHLTEIAKGKFRIEIFKDDGSQIKVAERKDKNILEMTATEISSFLNIPLKS